MTSTSSYSTALGPSALDRDNPWPGLDTFREADSEFFYGRVDEGRHLERLVRRERLTVLFGRSGLGKSSLLQAGLFPLLRAGAMLPIYVRLAQVASAPPARVQVLEAVARAAAAAGVEAPPADPEQTLWEYFHRDGVGFWTADNQLVTPVLVFDQFEEVFTLGAHLGRAEQTQAFLEELGDLIEGRVPRALRERIDAGAADRAAYDFAQHLYKVVLSLRADFVSELELLRTRIPSIAGNRMRLGPLTGDAALVVTAAGGTDLVPPAVGERIVRLVAGEAEDDQREPGAARVPLRELVIEPPLLSLFCRELNERRKQHGQERITPDLVAGSRAAILSGFYARCVRDVDPRVRAFVEDRLLTVGGFRNSVAEDDALATPGVTAEALDALVDRRLVRREERSGRTWLELTHDVLTSVVRDSGKARRAEEELARARADGEAQQRALLAAKSRTRRALILAGFALVTAVVAGFQWYRADVAGRLVAQSEFRSAAQLVESGDPQGALAWLASSITRDPDFESSRTLALQLLSSAHQLPTVTLRDTNTWAAAVTPDGRFIVTTGRGDTTLRVWAADGSDSGRVLVGRPETMNGIVFSPDGKRMATAGTDGGVQLWDTKSWTPYLLLAHAASVSEVAFSPDGGWIATAGEDSVARLWRTDRESRPVEMRGHGAGLEDVAISRDGKWVVTSTQNGVVAVWKFGATTPAYLLPQQDGPVFAIDVGRDTARWLVTGMKDGVALVWAFGDTVPRVRLHGHGDAVLDADFDPDGDRIATTSWDGTVRLWDARSGAPLGPAFRSGDFVTRVAFSPDGRRLVTASSDGTRLWELPWHAAATRQLPAGVGTVIGSSRDGRRVITSTGDAGGRLLLLDGSAAPVELRDPEGMSSQWAMFSADGERFATISAHDSGQRYLVWSVRERKPVGRAVTLQVGARSGVTLSADGRWIAVAGVDSTARLWAVDSAGRGTTLHVGSGTIHDVAFSPDGRHVATVASDSTITVWDAGTARKLRSHRVPVGELITLTYSPDGRWIATGSDDGTTRLWRADFSGGALVLRGHEDGIYGVVFDSAGRRLATWSSDSTARLWDARTGVALGPPLHAGGPIVSVAFAPDGQQAITMARLEGGDTETRVWPTWTGTPGDARAIADLAVAAAHARLDPTNGGLEALEDPDATSRAFRDARDQAGKATAAAPRSFDAFLRWYFGLAEPAVSRTALAGPPSRTRRP